MSHSETVLERDNVLRKVTVREPVPPHLRHSIKSKNHLQHALAHQDWEALEDYDDRE